jgi:hypothetical protein
MTTRNRPIIDACKRAIADVIDHARMLLHTNTFWITVAWMIYTFFSNLDPAWIVSHVFLKTWLPPAIAVASVIIKIMQNADENQK